VTWIVRQGRATDVEAVRAVASAAWRDTYKKLLTSRTIESFISNAYSPQYLERRIAQHFFLVVEGDEGVVAFADTIEEPDRVNLAAIYTLPELRNQGIGTFLLDGLRERFGRTPIAADVLVGNRKGEVFYERRGFVPREVLEAELFGEAVVERRWWLDPPRDQ
jgi:GNAT superfamily N-acetyltransferase